MQRRTFIKNTALGAVAVSASGFIRFEDNHYIGDCETTTDILGPFYRPDSPVRNNLVIQGDPGEAVELSGIINHNDCVTPYKNAKIELWHCDSNGVYDNTSDKYRYRGTTFSDDRGMYSFNTILPVPYSNRPGGRFRAAHFHLMITAEGYQPLVTQLYFTGDSNITKDHWASSPTAKKRILQVQNLKNGTRKVEYNVGMSEVLSAEPATIDKLAGIYKGEKDQNDTMEFFKKNNMLWLGGKGLMIFDYIGNNTFRPPGPPDPEEGIWNFEILPSGSVKLTITSYNNKGEKDIYVMVKEK